MTIKTWMERKLADRYITTEDAMDDEIDELRAAVSLAYMEGYEAAKHEVRDACHAEIDELVSENAYLSADRRDMFIELESLKLKLAEQRMIIFDHEMADYKGEAEMLHAQILEQRRVIESMQPRTIGHIGTACGEYVECSGRPDAPHGVDLEASFRTGRTVCVCKSWAPGEAS